MSDAPIALVTGANRGIGLEVCRQLARQGYIVFLGSRDLAKGQAAAAGLKRQGLEVLPRRLDVTDRDTIEQVRAEIDSTFGRLDGLVNNAAILYDTWQRVLNADLGVVREALETNTLGAWQMCQAFVPLLRRSQHGRIVNVSSTDMGGAGGKPVAEGTASVVWAVTLPDGGPTGGFFRDGQPLPW